MGFSKILFRHKFMYLQEKKPPKNPEKTRIICAWRNVPSCDYINRVHLPLQSRASLRYSKGIKMRFHQQAIFLALCLAIVGDIGSLINSVWTGSDLASQNPELLIPGADASGIFSQVLRRAHIRKSRYSKLTKKRPTKGKWSRKQREPRVSGKPRG